MEAKNTHSAYLNMSLKYATEIHDIGTVRQIFYLNKSQTAVEFHWLSIYVLYVATRRSYQM